MGIDGAVSIVGPPRVRGLKSVSELDNELIIKTPAIPDSRTTSGENIELQPEDPISFLILSRKLWEKGFGSMLGVLLARVLSGVTNTGEVTYCSLGVR
jgi:hypothetical protein